MQIYRNISLKEHNTFGIDVKTDVLLLIQTPEDAAELAGSSYTARGKYLITGKGSNLLYLSDYRGTVIKSCIDGIIAEKQGDDSVVVRAGSGTDWDTLVGWCVSRGYGGLENLSAIPGTAGAAPVQNIGAYGTEVKDVIEKVRAVSVTDGRIKEFSAGDCRFAYRDSVFKNEEKGKWLIAEVWFRLSTRPLFSFGYSGLKEEAERLGGVTLANVRQAVINIRGRKLPDPANTGNAGSFFKNPVVANEVAEMLRSRYPGVILYADPSGGFKVPAGWLIEQCGWKGRRTGDAGVWEKQALVLVNYGKATGREIFELSEMIRKSVYEKFGIALEREVEIVE
ncbi:MAG TPA: UDP-N-acetylmuramate dehydrogenase [Bacteroidales bacterium]|nr:UDP-N-acetylmuramate dehydrogenase [Bacteroidales bacterium]HRT90543.1 UDP-N-acetylmuramate dehydrogenase [Bacteroidales bacterium]